MFPDVSTFVTNSVLLIGITTVISSMGLMLMHPVLAQDIIQVSKLPSGPEVGLEDQTTIKDEKGQEAATEESNETKPEKVTEEETVDEESNKTTSEQEEGTPKVISPKSPVGGLTPGNVTDTSPDNITPSGINVQIVVTFNSITVHNKHEGAISGDGEYDLVAYVQGRIVRLTDASVGGDLYDVENGQTVNFKPGTQIITEIPNTFPVSIFTVGSEVDSCGRTSFPDNIQQELPIFFDPQLDWLTPIAEFQHSYNSNAQVCGKFSGPLWDENEILGTIREFYDPPDHGVGIHAVKSSTGDFTLRYTINKGDACNASIC
jgi:hypothetical protein